MSSAPQILNEAVFKCVNGHEFNLFIIAGIFYGEFLLYSKNGERRYLNSFEDSAFDEVSAIVKDIIKDSGDRDRLNIFQEIFGPVCCDADSKGDFFFIPYSPCPVCGTMGKRNMHGYTGKNETFDVFPVTHLSWNKLSSEEKVKRVERIVIEFCNGGIMAIEHP